MDKPLTTEQVLKDLRDAYLMPREVPEGWVTAKMVSEELRIGRRAASCKLDKLADVGKWETGMALVDGHVTRIYRPIITKSNKGITKSDNDSTVMVEK